MLLLKRPVRSINRILMARILSQTLIRESQALISDIFPSNLVNGVGARLLAPSARLLNLRSRSKRSENEAESYSDVEINDDAMSGIIARRSAPSWLPFVPGSSYWVPPKKMSARRSSMGEVGTLSFRNVRGWPSSVFSVEGILPDEAYDGQKIAVHLDVTEVDDGKS